MMVHWEPRLYSLHDGFSGGHNNNSVSFLTLLATTKGQYWGGESVSLCTLLVTWQSCVKVIHQWISKQNSPHEKLPRKQGDSISRLNVRLHLSWGWARKWAWHTRKWAWQTRKWARWPGIMSGDKGGGGQEEHTYTVKIIKQHCVLQEQWIHNLISEFGLPTHIWFQSFHACSKVRPTHC